jgi:hypothetical protein
MQNSIHDILGGMGRSAKPDETPSPGLLKLRERIEVAKECMKKF